MMGECNRALYSADIEGDRIVVVRLSDMSSYDYWSDGLAIYPREDLHLKPEDVLALLSDDQRSRLSEWSAP
jgi:hypothetical protein